MTADVWATVHHERRALLRDLETLTPEQWAAPTACSGWDVHDVVAHLVDTAKTTRLGFVRGLIAARLDFDRQNAIGVARERRDDPRDTLGALRAVLTRVSTPPAPIATRLVEAFVHGEDIRRAAGISDARAEGDAVGRKQHGGYPAEQVGRKRHGGYPAEQVGTALKFQLRTAAGVGGGRERACGLRIIAVDTAVDSGAGPEVHGSAIALLLAVSGRPTGPGELTGPGAAELQRRSALPAGALPKA